MNISISSPDLTEAELSAVTEVVETRYLSIGPKLNAFDEHFADYVGAAHAAGVNSGTSGLHLCMIAAGIEPGDLVITTPFSFVASPTAFYMKAAFLSSWTWTLSPATSTRTSSSTLCQTLLVEATRPTAGYLRMCLPPAPSP